MRIRLALVLATSPGAAQEPLDRARLTASPSHLRAAEWARDRFSEWGLSSARLEPFEFGRG